MRIDLGVLALVVGFGLAASSPAHAQDVDPVLRADIIKLMDTTGVAKLSVQMSSLLTQQLQDNIRSQHPEVPQRVLDIGQQVAQEEVAKLVDGPNGLLAQMVPVYAKYYTDDEIKGLMAFYESELGRKSLSVVPAILQESMAISRKWAADARPRIQKEVQDRLKAEGLVQ